MHNLVHLYAAKVSLSRPEKERKIQLCNKVLDVLTKVDSGYTIWRGTLLQVSYTVAVQGVLNLPKLHLIPCSLFYALN